MFKSPNGNNDGPMQAVPPTNPEFPDMIAYEVHHAGGIEVVSGHSCQVVDGCLLIHRGVFLDTACQQPGAVPARFYAAGTWQNVRTTYAGYSRRSELALH